MKTFILLISFIFLACNNNKTGTKIQSNKQTENSENELLITTQLIKSQNFAINKLKLKPINALKQETLRIWRFPGGGACFEELYELDINKKELKLYSYLIEDFGRPESKKTYDLEYEKIIINKELIENLIKFSNEKVFLSFKNCDEYCKNNLVYGDFFLVEYKDNSGLNTCSINESIVKCSNKKAESTKEFFDLIKKIISENGN